MKGFSVDNQSKTSSMPAPKEPPAFVPLDCHKPQFAHLKTSGKRFVSMVSKVDPKYQRLIG